MVDIVHVGDLGTTIYLPTVSAGVPLDTTLDLFTLRMAWLLRPGLAPIIEISDIPTAIDPLDNILKLKLVTGTDTGTLLTGTGNFALREADVGDWLCAIALAHETGYWSDGPFRLLTLKRVKPAMAPAPLHGPAGIPGPVAALPTTRVLHPPVDLFAGRVGRTIGQPIP